MARFITSLNHFNREEATPEEIEAYRVSHEALYNRMNSYLRKAETARRMATPVTDAYGRPIRSAASC
jgi:hypothetical protein